MYDLTKVGARVFAYVAGCIVFVAIVSFLLITNLDLSSISRYQMPVEFYETETIVLSNQQLVVWLAKTEDERATGLSFIDPSWFKNQDVNGMLFLFNDDVLLEFWMKDMQFDLDVVWIDNGEIVKIDQDIPSPERADGDTVRMSSDPYEVDMVLELPAGSVADLGIETGDVLTK